MVFNHDTLRISIKSIFLIACLYIGACKFSSNYANAQNSQRENVIVHDVSEFKAAAKNAKPGDIITLANGIWKDVELRLVAEGTADNPIRVVAQDKGEVFLEGQSDLKIGGSYIVVEGLVFRNGYTPTSSIISFQRDKETPCNNCRVTECVIDDYNPPERFDADYWVEIWGKNNRFDHNYLVGKRNRGVTLAVRLKNERDRENYHRIDHNYFGYHPILGSNGGETLRIGTSHYSLSNSNTVVEDNYFEKCNGEHEIISSKSCQNIFRNNTFYECQGTLTMRHGNETLVENNYFFGNRKANTGGIRIINETQTVRNNYCEGLTGYRFRGALVIMNGVPNSPLNRYFQVKDSDASNNLIIDCDYVQLCAGSDKERSATPVNTTFKNNVIYNESKDEIFTVYDDVSGIDFEENVLSENMAFPQYGDQILEEGFRKGKMNFETKNGIKHLPDLPDIGPKIGDIPGPENTGVTWYPKKDYEIHFNTGKVISINPGENTLYDAIKNAEEGDIIQLSEPGDYHQTKSIDITCAVSIIATKSDEKPVITFERPSLINIENGGSIYLSGLHISGKECDDYAGNTVMRTSRYSMINNYKLIVKDCDFTDLDVNHSFNVLKVYKNTFADSIVLSGCSFENISGHVLNMDKEFDDIGIYNVEDVEIVNCQFKNVGGSAVKLYRGGRDESTFGPILKMSNTTFENVGHDKRNKNEASVSIHGVQLAELSNLYFKKSRKLKMHLIVGEPVIKLDDISFDNCENMESNSEAYEKNNISILNPQLKR